MNLIVNVDKNWAIGNKNKLLVSIPADMRFFRETTQGNVVIMGRKTLESFPQGQPLKNRVNIVITRDPDYQVKGAVVVHSVEEAVEESRKYEGEVFVIGGESIYRAMLPLCDRAYVTKTDHAYQADTWFPNLDEDEEWEMTAVTEEQTCFDLEYVFSRYERKKAGRAGEEHPEE
ncbi:MAG TPA: dihydrofolate reductase [Candidatus Bariatricus faecipullorum]|nr:dihydrofolate reductase [Candidatus Bariatricus faecipullorum]